MKLNWLEKFGMNSYIHTIELRAVVRRALQLGGRVEGGRVLEIGCGGGLGVELILEHFGPSFVDAFEFDPELLERARRRLLPRYENNVKLYVASATAIPSPDNRFDAVFDFGVLHHIPDNERALKEIARVLKPSGRFFFQELLSSFTRSPLMRLLTDHPPEAQFTWQQLAGKLAKAGLIIRDKSVAPTAKRVVGVAWKSPKTDT